jgi:hypothetical protein
MPRAQGDPKSKVIGTTLKEHERDALNEFLRDKKMTRYTWLRLLVLGALVDEGYLEVTMGSREDIDKGADEIRSGGRIIV